MNSNNTLPPVVVIRANDNCFLDVMRSLGQNNIPFVPVVFTWHGASAWISAKSRYFLDSVTISNPADNEHLALDGLLALGKKLVSQYKQKCILLPTSDTILMFIQYNFSSLSPYFLQMGPNNFETCCLDLIDKTRFAYMLEKSNIATPTSISVECEADVPNAVDNISYPCIYKPSVKDLKNSFQTEHNGAKAIACADKETLKVALYRELKRGHKLIVQKKININSLEQEGSVYVYRDSLGNIRAVGGMRVLYRYPKNVGTGAILKPNADHAMYMLAIAATNASNWCGFIGYEMMWDADIGGWTIIEANLRPWLSIRYQSVLGVDFIDLLYKDITNTLPPFEKTTHIKVQDINYIGLTSAIVMFISELGDEKDGMLATLKYINENIGKLFFAYGDPLDSAPGACERELLYKRYPEHVETVDLIYNAMLNNNLCIVY